jgi:hypothetical protein
MTLKVKSNFPIITKIINNTQYTLKEVQSFSRYGGFMNYWRHRRVDVYQPPVDYIEEYPGYVFTVSYNFETDTYWICEEPYAAYEGRIINADWRDYR